MRELQASRGRDDKTKREQAWHEKEMQRFGQLAEAQRQQQQEQQQQQESLDLEPGNISVAQPMQDQRSALKFAFASKTTITSKAFEETLVEDLEEDFYLPITHRPTENLDTDNMEQATVDTQLTSSNVGFRLLQKMGWKGKGLGKDEQGIVEPIQAKCRDAKLGLGKQEQDDFYTAEENVHRKKLDVELEETEELAKKREVEAEREQKIQSEVKEIRKVFFCELCNKQYKLAMEFEAHLSSYDHNHKKRFKEMRELQASRGRDDKKKREQARHEKELQRFAQLAEAQRQQQQEQQQQQESLDFEPGNINVAQPMHDQRSALKFGFASKTTTTSKMSFNGPAKRTKLVAKVAAVFQDESEEEG